MNVQTVLVSAVLLTVSSVVCAQDETLKEGSEAPVLACKDIAGKPIDWKRCGDRAVLVFFHSQEMSYSRRGLDEICGALLKEDALLADVFLLLVTSGSRDVEELDVALKKTGISFAITVDEKREQFKPYGVVAFPTVFTIDKSRIVRHIDRGFGPMLKSKVVAAARHATGKIKADVYRALVSTRGDAALSEEDVRVSRTVRMVEHLVEHSMFEQARVALERVLTAESKNGKGIATFADLLLRMKKPEQAAPWIERLEVIEPNAIVLPVLRAELAILQGSPKSALQLLEKHKPPGVRVLFLRGRALELLGRFEEASGFYREALRISLKRDT